MEGGWKVRKQQTVKHKAGGDGWMEEDNREEKG